MFAASSPISILEVHGHELVRYLVDGPAGSGLVHGAELFDNVLGDLGRVLLQLVQESRGGCAGPLDPEEGEGESFS